MLAHSAYGAGDMLNAAEQAGHTPIIKPWPLRSPVEDTFTRDDFTVDEDTASLRVGLPTLGSTRPNTHARPQATQNRSPGHDSVRRVTSGQKPGGTTRSPAQPPTSPGCGRVGASSGAASSGDGARDIDAAAAIRSGQALLAMAAPRPG
jgi:hypothetical protein